MEALEPRRRGLELTLSFLPQTLPLLDHEGGTGPGGDIGVLCPHIGN